jgi:hypothetical protein
LTADQRRQGVRDAFVVDWQSPHAAALLLGITSP